MAAFETIRGVVIIGMIAGLLALGLWLTLRSGVTSLATSQGRRQVRENLSQAMLMLGACAFGVVLIHHAVGLPLGLSW